MEGNKFDVAAKEREPTNTSATYKQIPEDDMEEQTAAETKPMLDGRSTEPDGADERMLPDEEKKLSNSNVNVADVKFTTNDKQNGDAKLDIGEVKSEFVGMTKEELMKYANDPFWVRLRWILFIAFWLLWAGMLVGAIMIIVAAPKCSPPEPKTWWEEGPLVEVDVKTTPEKLDMLTSNGVTGLIVPYPEDTYKLLNTTETFVTFLKLAKDKNFKVIVELNPGTSSAWFDDSARKDAIYSDWYIWAGREGVEENSKPPNNWLSKQSTDDNEISAWKYSPVRKQFYLAPSSTPQLNFRIDAVIEAFSNVVTSFLDAGASGIRLKGGPNLLVDEDFADEPLSNKPSDVTQGDYSFYKHSKTENLKELGPLLMQWRDIVKNKTDHGVFMLAENLYTLDPYKVNETLAVDLPKHSQIFEEGQLTAAKLKTGLENALKFLEGHWPLWQVKQTDLEMDVLKVVPYLLKGTTIVGSDVSIEPELKETRKSPSITFGTQDFFSIANNTVFAYVRVHSGNPGFVVAINPTDERVSVDFPAEIPLVSDEVTVQYLSRNFNESNVEMRMKSSARMFPMSPKSSVVLSYVPKE